MATRRFFCLIEAGVTPIACSRNHVAWSKRETYMREFMWLVKSYSEARTAPLNVWTQSAMINLSLFAIRSNFQLLRPVLQVLSSRANAATVLPPHPHLVRSRRESKDLLFVSPLQGLRHPGVAATRLNSISHFTPGLAPRAHVNAAAARLIGHQHLAFVPPSDCDLSYDTDSFGTRS